jgi:DNA-binding CsgD family transcriptional regulator
MFEFQDIVQSPNLFLVAKDTNHKFVYCNNNFAHALGFDSPNQLLGKTDEDIFDNTHSAIYRAGDVHILRGGIFVNVPESQPHVSRIAKILTTKNQMRSNTGEIKGIVVSFIDITGLAYRFVNELMNFTKNGSNYYFKVGNQNEYFTEGQYRVFKYLVFGYPSKSIAEILSLSHRTVENYVNTIKIKLQCGSKHHIPEAAMRLGIIQQGNI